MTRNALRFAGCLAMANAVITLPVFFTLMSLDTGIRTISASIQVTLLSGVCSAIAVFLMLSLRKYVHSTTGSDSLKKPILVLVYGYLLSFFFTSINTFFILDMRAASSLAIASVLILGLLQTYLGLFVYRLGHNLGGFRKFYSILLILTGISSASVALYPLSLFFSAISDVLLSTIFFQGSKELPLVDEVSNNQLS